MIVLVIFVKFVITVIAQQPVTVVLVGMFLLEQHLKQGVVNRDKQQHAPIVLVIPAQTMLLPVQLIVTMVLATVPMVPVSKSHNRLLLYPSLETGNLVNQ